MGWHRIAHGHTGPHWVTVSHIVDTGSDMGSHRDCTWSIGQQWGPIGELMGQTGGRRHLMQERLDLTTGISPEFDIGRRMLLHMLFSPTLLYTQTANSCLIGAEREAKHIRGTQPCIEKLGNTSTKVLALHNC